MISPGWSQLQQRRNRRAWRYSFLGLTVGLIFGFAVCLWIKPTLLPCTNIQSLQSQINHIRSHRQERSDLTKIPNVSAQKKQVLIGVMTAAKFIDTRVKAVWETWAQSIEGDVIFFSSETTQTRPDFPIMPLPGVGDSYPPQKKSFMMVKYLYEFGRDKYRYFMRADDDVYIHGPRLSDFLHGINESETLFIGQAGTGSPSELGLLSLGPDENYCMGGPGIIFSRETLRRMVPHISYCLQNLPTTHEDVELGRCVRMFAGVGCTFNYEMQKTFFHSYAYRRDNHIFPYNFDGPEIDRAITLHPVKSVDTMYKLHREMQVRQRSLLQLRQYQLQQDLSLPPSSADGMAVGHNKASYVNYRQLATPWLHFNMKVKYSQSMFSMKRNNEQQWKWYIRQAIQFVILTLNKEALSKGRLLEYKDVIYGYRRTTPFNGEEVILNLKLDYKQIKGKYLRLDVKKRIKLNKHFMAPFIREITPKCQPAAINLILPLSGKVQPFRAFMKQFEKLYQKDNILLLVMLYNTSTLGETLDIIQSSPAKRTITTNLLSGKFSRAIALHEGLSSLPGNSLVLFIDVDIHFTLEGLQRVRENTILNKQLYYPIVFSQYDSNVVCSKDVCPAENHSPETGSFRYFGFGIASMYKTDYFATDGFDLSINGWGKEDVDLFWRTVKVDHLSVMRAADPGFTHIYHPVRCDTTLDSDQAAMCLNSKSASFASQRILSQMFLQNEKLNLGSVNHED